MKNIHLISTDKPSVLGYVICTEKSTLTLFEDVMDKASRFFPQNIYITNNSEIKEGDWCLSKLNEVVKFGKKFTTSLYKKIILTTDRDLIKDGVQAIDNHFLEWFVKNPSCESVGFNDWLDTNGNIAWGGDKRYQIYSHLYDKIIIPQKEHKDSVDKFFDSLSDDELKEKWNKYEQCSEQENSVTISEFIKNIKQETVEEAAERYFPLAEKIGGETYTSYKGFIAGAKWQADRMYSEEEVKNIIECYLHYLTVDSKLDADEWFEQFKKK
jgi:Mor family transcriptional regulator